MIRVDVGSLGVGNCLSLRGTKSMLLALFRCPFSPLGTLTDAALLPAIAGIVAVTTTGATSGLALSPVSDQTCPATVSFKCWALRELQITLHVWRKLYSETDSISSSKLWNSICLHARSHTKSRTPKDSDIRPVVANDIRHWWGRLLRLLCSAKKPAYIQTAFASYQTPIRDDSWRARCPPSR
jgi:hypothetical protein